MFKINKIIAFIFISIAISTFGCVSIISQDEKNNWLQSKLQKPSSIDIEGFWVEDMGYYGWGDGYFRQNGDKITGSFGGYQIDGIISGEDIYILLTYKEQTRYMAHLNPFEGNLVGYYYQNLDFKNGRSIVLKGGKIKKK